MVRNVRKQEVVTSSSPFGSVNKTTNLPSGYIADKSSTIRLRLHSPAYQSRGALPLYHSMYESFFFLPPTLDILQWSYGPIIYKVAFSKLPIPFPL